MLEEPEEEAAHIEDQAETEAGENPFVAHEVVEQELGVNTTTSNGEGPQSGVQPMETGVTSTLSLNPSQ